MFLQIILLSVVGCNFTIWFSLTSLDLGSSSSMQRLSETNNTWQIHCTTPVGTKLQRDRGRARLVSAVEHLQLTRVNVEPNLLGGHKHTSNWTIMLLCAFQSYKYSFIQTFIHTQEENLGCPHLQQYWVSKHCKKKCHTCLVTVKLPLMQV